MDIELLEILTQFGFPALMCGALMWYVSRTVDTMSESLNKNTVAVNSLEVMIKTIIQMLKNE